LEIRTSVPLLGRKKLSEGGTPSAKSGPKTKKDDSKVDPKIPKAKPGVGKAKRELPEAFGSEEEELDALLKMDGMFPPAGGLELDEMGDAELVEALREIESGDLFGIDDLFSGVLDDAGAKGAIGGAGKSTGKGKSKKAMPDDGLGDLDLLAALDDELGADLELGKASKGRRAKKSDNLDPELLEAFGVSKDEFAAIEAAEAAEAAGALIGGSAAAEGTSLPLNLDIDGLDLDSEEFSLTPGVGGVTSAIVGKEGELGTELPPLEEFKRLMDSLGPDNMFSDDLLFGLLDEPDIDEEMVLSGKQLRDFDYKQQVLVEMRDNEDGEGPVEYHDGERWNGEELPSGDLTPRVDPDEKDPYYDVYAPNIYDGGRARSNVEKYKIDPKVVSKAREFNRYLYAAEPDEAIQARVRIISVVTNSTRNSTALEIVQKVYDYIKAGTERDKDKIDYEIHCYKYDDDSEVRQLCILVFFLILITRPHTYLFPIFLLYIHPLPFS